MCGWLMSYCQAGGLMSFSEEQLQQQQQQRRQWLGLGCLVLLEGKAAEFSAKPVAWSSRRPVCPAQYLLTNARKHNTDRQLLLALPEVGFVQAVVLREITLTSILTLSIFHAPGDVGFHAGQQGFQQFRSKFCLCWKKKCASSVTVSLC